MPKDLEMLLRTTYFGTIMMVRHNIDTADKKQKHDNDSTHATKQSKETVQTKLIQKKLCRSHRAADLLSQYCV